MRSPDTPTDNCLAGKVCLVVGAGSLAHGWAIGKAVAVAYARAGAQVVVGDIDKTAAQAVADLIGRDGGVAIAQGIDASDEASVRAAISATVDRFGCVSVLHNNVGIGKSGDSSNTTVADWRRISDANLLSLHILTQAVLPVMTNAGGGVILNTSSITSISHIGVNHLAYGVTKAAANHFCKLVAVEYASAGIRANALVVGTVDTPRIRNTMLAAYGTEEDMLRKRSMQVPLGFTGDAWDVANAAVFLASDRARFISGMELVIDGALTATTRT